MHRGPQLENHVIGLVPKLGPPASTFYWALLLIGMGRDRHFPFPGVNIAQLCLIYCVGALWGTRMCV